MHPAERGLFVRVLSLLFKGVVETVKISSLCPRHFRNPAQLWGREGRYILNLRCAILFWIRLLSSGSVTSVQSSDIGGFELLPVEDLSFLEELLVEEEWCFDLVDDIPPDEAVISTFLCSLPSPVSSKPESAAPLSICGDKLVLLPLGLREEPAEAEVMMTTGRIVELAVCCCRGVMGTSVSSAPSCSCCSVSSFQRLGSCDRVLKFPLCSRGSS